MTSGHGEDPTGPEPNFADVVNAFSFDSHRAGKKRRRGWWRAEEEPPEDQPAWMTAPVPERAPAPAPIEFPLPRQVEEEDEQPVTEGASAVRPYAWTRGRTRPGLDLAIETLLSTSQRGREQMVMLTVEHRSVAQLCEQTRSVAEVAALLSIPLGVARVLLGDMAGMGLVKVHQTAGSTGNGPDLALMERVLSGLRRL
ncbi:MAG: DUF742 domain-containing protein [Pseudonocardia sp.]